MTNLESLVAGVHGLDRSWCSSQARSSEHSLGARPRRRPSSGRRRARCRARPRPARGGQDPRPRSPPPPARWRGDPDRRARRARVRAGRSPESSHSCWRWRSDWSWSAPWSSWVSSRSRWRWSRQSPPASSSTPAAFAPIPSTSPPRRDPLGPLDRPPRHRVPRLRGHPRSGRRARRDRVPGTVRARGFADQAFVATLAAALGGCVPRVPRLQPPSRLALPRQVRRPARGLPAGGGDDRGRGPDRRTGPSRGSSSCWCGPAPRRRDGGVRAHAPRSAVGKHRGDHLTHRLTARGLASTPPTAS